ncbi:virulence-associated E family protein [Fusobacterium polymorphum]|uniref:Virulence-associated protein E n=1 Tax=Fusobacterium nucleatum subsp. polymorphum TaxID=76857 RepID=A0A2C6C9T7_FUSNP|nr:virulence-associated E family protein [Fusobacterium polymorphum]PHI13627.1 virulence-associated protein E [Fusobacterium polymorphum]
MENSRKLIISEANNRHSKQWVTTEITWSEFVERLGKPKITAETLDEFLSYSKAKQDDIKDVGGFVGGKLKGNLRRSEAVESRSLITLDLDNLAYEDDTKIIKTLNSLGCAYAVYSTRKHQTTKPRIRVILPLAEDVSTDEYEPIARKVAESIGLRYCDPTTFQAVRLMYWPSHSTDSDYVFTYADKPMLDGKAVLNMYTDWRDVTTWPEVPDAQKLHQNMLKKQENPLEKEGMVGAFCRRFNIYQAIDEFLPGTYEACDVVDRLTFVGGSTTAGAIVYQDGLFLYSHHATDPCSQKLVNAFDLVRLHKFGHKDISADVNTPVAKLPSWIAMKEWVMAKTDVKKDLLKERQQKAIAEFSITYDKNEEVLEGEIVEDDDIWKDDIQYSADGMKALSTLSNIILILRNDKELKFKIFKDIFSSRILVRDGVPWDRKFETPDRIWTDTDDAGLRWYLESNYGITSTNKIIDGVNLIAEENAENKVATRLQLTQWDGEKRLETLFIDYLGCTDNAYTREISEKSLVAAVRRAIFGGIKWDNMPILIGPQGAGKSTFLKILGMDWYNDSLVNVEGKDACELIQGSWIIEMGELSSLRKSEMNLVKNFLSRTDDIFRASYGRRAQKYPRRCAFFGTANDTNFLRDETGNRRFWPIDCFIHKPKKSIFDNLKDELEQIWAEACELAKNEYYSLVLSKEALEIAVKEQELHLEDNVYKGIILDYLDKKIPKNWNTMDLFGKRTYLDEYENSKEHYNENDLILRDRVCAAEIWEEALRMDIRYLKKSDSIELNKILSNLYRWEKMRGTARFGKYGVQRGYKRKTES